VDTHVESHPRDTEECGIELDRAILLDWDIYFQQDGSRAKAGFIRRARLISECRT